MATWRLLPPVGIAKQTITVNGRPFSVSPGASLDAADFDAAILRANGWVFLGPVGTTAQRPTVMPAGAMCYIDTTLDKPIFHDGSTWRDHKGASV